MFLDTELQRLLNTEYMCITFLLEHTCVYGVTSFYYGSIPVTNEPHLVSRESKSIAISGGDSSYSWVFICALDLLEERSCRLYRWVGSWRCVGSWKAPVPLQ